MSASKVHLLPVLCLLVILTTFNGSTESASCCTDYVSRPRRCKQLLNYSIQSSTGSCDLPAIIFHLKGRFVCADPSQEWVQRRMQCLNDRRRNAEKVSVVKPTHADLKTQS